MKKALIFRGTLEKTAESTSGYLADYITKSLEDLGIETKIFDLSTSGIPLFDTTLTRIPKGVELMNNLFQEADIHFWLAPLYHGSIPGVMKNCLDWLEISSKATKPYLTDKTVGLVCWADGAQAMQGINAMDAIAKALRAWPLPFNVPIVRKDLFQPNDAREVTPFYQHKLDLLIKLAATKEVVTV